MSRLSEVVHINVSIAKFKALVKAMTKVRYVVDHENKIHVGNAYEFIHSQIKRQAGCYDDRDGLVHGYAYWDGTQMQHYIYYVYDGDGRYKDGYNLDSEWVHPRLAEIEARGVTRTHEKFDFVA